MGNLVMSFRGLWTHIAKEFLPDGIQDRVVAVNATRGANTTAWGALPAHHCYLEANEATSGKLKDQVPMEKFQGWRVRVTNASSSTFSSNLIVPKLTYYVPPGMRLWPDLLESGIPARAACFVDILLGTIETNAYDAPPDHPEMITGVYTTWRVETKSDPELLFESRDGHSITVQIPSTPDGERLSDNVFGSLVLHNSTTNFTDKQNDFVLSYLAREGGIPNANGFIHRLPGQEGPITTFVDMTPSCSNSQYP